MVTGNQGMTKALIGRENKNTPFQFGCLLARASLSSPTVLAVIQNKAFNEVEFVIATPVGDKISTPA